MADELTAKVENVGEPQTKVAEIAEPKTESIDELKLKVEELTRTVANKTEEAIRVHNKLEKYEKDEDDRKIAAMSEMDRLKLEAENAKKEVADLKQNLQRREIAAKLELPEVLIDRIKGVTPEEMEADAKQLLEQLPQARPVISATNPGADHNTGETREQRMKRLA